MAFRGETNHRVGGLRREQEGSAKLQTAGPLRGSWPRAWEMPRGRPRSGGWEHGGWRRSRPGALRRRW